jgi:hypothetical protein
MPLQAGVCLTLNDKNVEKNQRKPEYSFFNNIISPENLSNDCPRLLSL